MTDEEMAAEYKAAKDEYEAAESALARARRRLDLASRAMCEALDKHWRAAEARYVERKGSPFRRRINKAFAYGIGLGVVLGWMIYTAAALGIYFLLR